MPTGMVDPICVHVRKLQLLQQLRGQPMMPLMQKQLRRKLRRSPAWPQLTLLQLTRFEGQQTHVRLRYGLRMTPPTPAMRRTLLLSLHTALTCPYVVSLWRPLEKPPTQLSQLTQRLAQPALLPRVPPSVQR